MKFGQWLGLIILIISLYILWQIRQMLLLIFAAVVLATALNRLVRLLQQRGLKRSLAVAATLSSSLLIGILFFFLIVPPFVEQFQKLIELIPDVFLRMREELEVFEDLLRETLPKPLPDPPDIGELIAQLQPVGTELLVRFVEFFQNSLGIALKLLLVFVLTLMMLANPQGYRRAAIHLFPSFYRRRADDILNQCEVALGNWLAGIVLNSLFIAMLSGIGLAILNIQFLLTHALLAGVLNFIPNIGPALSVVFPIMIALLDSPWKILAVLIWYAIIQNIESYWLTPTVMAKQVSLLPAVTLVAQIFFTTAFGIVGLLLALPLTVVAKTWIEEALFKDILDPWGSEDTRELDIFPEFILEPEIGASDLDKLGRRDSGETEAGETQY
ncbi:AI-2E family transporter [Oscillatoriales cyanobacterium LEGE 11467]|uniref:AI-2E family transporter n=1 Tax=Zarconia navalis LEGE 11467 TaxID=1828826 RepID=A0A928VX09_9CYAN|nr:AI-2E family transporter [Zarconia navalis]MBE9041691.1 AI-2E family transporter [Zarconia navalis LEGE 11467]